MTREMFLFIWLAPMIISVFFMSFYFHCEKRHISIIIFTYIISCIPFFNILVVGCSIAGLLMLIGNKNHKGDNMNFKNNTIDNALNKKKQVEELEKKLIQEKETMNQMKNIAKKDLEWILND